MLLGLWACARAPEQPAPERAAPELWVDEHALEGGDGSRPRPLRRLPARVPEGVALHLATGVYSGPLVVSRRASVESAGTAVITATQGTVVDATDASLKGVSVQGGDVGLVVHGTVTLVRLHFSGHRQAGLRVGPGARALLDDGTWEGVVGEARGVDVEGGTFEARGARFTGPFAGAVRCRAQGVVKVARLNAEGTAIAVNAADCTSTVSGVVAGGRGPALFFARGTATVQGVTVTGHEFALQTRPDTHLVVQGLTSVGAQSGGVALVQSDAVLDEVTIERSGSLGALSLLEGKALVKHLVLRDVQSLGVLVRKGQATLEDVRVERVRGEDQHTLGDAVHVRDAQVELGSLEVHDAEGAALFVAARSQVKGRLVVSERAGAGAVVVERGAEVHLEKVTAQGSTPPAVAATEGAMLEVQHLAVRGGGDVPVWAECGGATRIEVARLSSAVTLPASPCVHIGSQTQGWEQ